jgi:hypothetical protein
MCLLENICRDVGIIPFMVGRHSTDGVPPFGGTAGIITKFLRAGVGTAQTGSPLLTTFYMDL